MASPSIADLHSSKPKGDIPGEPATTGSRAVQLWKAPVTSYLEIYPTPGMYVFFCGGKFSNWHKEGHIGLQSKRFWCVEQEMMFAKAMVMGDGDTGDKIMRETSNARRLKSLGREVRNFQEEKWAAVRYEMVRDAVRAKFTQNQDLKRALKATGEKIIVEAAWYDTIWGVGFAEWSEDGFRGIKRSDTEWDARPGDWTGQNLLGKCLMEVRAGL